MKEIKFRAWDTKKQIFVPNGDIIFSDYGDTRITVNPNCMEYIGDSRHNYNEDSRFKIMQYTGLKDKNGVEIYDGDLLNCFGDIAEVYYDINQALFRYRYKSGDETYMEILGIHSYEHFEVIGNIYENKELLN